jgi:hypothetical protein
MSVKIEGQKEKVSDVLPENDKPQEEIENDTEKEGESGKIKIIPTPVESLLNRNLDAKKMLADELSEMGLSVDEILKILRF